MKKAVQEARVENIYRLEGRVPIAKAIPFGLQHVLAMFVANIAPLIIISSVAVYNGQPFTAVETARLLQNCMLIAGIGTLLQLYPIWKIGSGLPVVMGISFTFLAACLATASQDYGIMVGAIIIGGCFEGILGLTAKYWRRLISPIVSACVVVSIGLSILNVGVSSFGSSAAYPLGSWQNLLVATITLAAALIFHTTLKGVAKQLYVLLGMIVGYVVSIFFGMVDFASMGSTIRELGIVAVPQLFAFKPQFQMGAILSFCLVFIVSAVETIGDTTACCTGRAGPGYHRGGDFRLPVRGRFCLRSLRRRVRLLSHHLLQPECGPDLHDPCGQPLYYHVRRAGHDFGRTVSAYRSFLHYTSGLCAGRLYSHYVRFHYDVRYPDDVRCGNDAPQHADCRHGYLHRRGCDPGRGIF